MALGDFLSEEEKWKFFTEQFQPGRILYLHCDFTTPPKPKYLLTCCIEPRPHFFIINSGINEFKRLRHNLRNLQVRIECVSHPCLSDDSYIDCSTLIDGENIPDLEEQVMADIGRLKDPLDQDTKTAVLLATLMATTLSAQQKALVQEGLTSV